MVQVYINYSYTFILFLTCRCSSAPVQQPTDQWKIVGDNLDLTGQVREMCSDNKDKSLHFFQT